MPSQTSSEPKFPSQMVEEPAGGPLGPYLGAAAGAAVGAGVWGLVAWLTGYEVGYVAWAIGLATGGGAVLLKGRGSQVAVVAAALALAGIAGGKILGVRLALDGEVRTFGETMLTREVYDQRTAAAAALMNVRTEEQTRNFMVDYDFTEASEPEDIGAEEFAEFAATTEPELRAWSEHPPEFDAWREDLISGAQSVAAAEFSPTEALSGSLGAMDLLFGVLGVITAYKMVAGRTAAASSAQAPSVPSEPPKPA